MQDFVEVFEDIKSNYPNTIKLNEKLSHILIPIDEEIQLELKYNTYPKCPKAKLVKNDGDRFNLDTIISSLKKWDRKNPLSLVELIDEIFLYINSMKTNQIYLKDEFFDGLMEMCKKSHPNKISGILAVDKGVVSEIILSSQQCATSTLYNPLKEFKFIQNMCQIPFDLSYEGTFISRPSGDLSINEELQLLFKRRRFTMLLGAPYTAENLRLFNSKGEDISYKIIESSNT